MNYTDSFEDKYFINVYNGCWEWIAAKDSKGYGVFRGEGSHRVAFRIYAGSPSNQNVCHKCDNPGCVNPNHLFLGTQKDNVRDMIQKNRQKPGKGRPFDSINRPPQSHLHPEQVKLIRTSNESDSAVAKQYGLSTQTINKIRNRRTYAWL